MALVRRGLAPTRERAQSLILGGKVRVDGAPGTKPSQAVGEAADVAVEGAGDDFASRGAHKLAAALQRWNVAVEGLAALDVGASTGGFTDLLLRRGARRVYAVDVGYGQLHYRLRQDVRVVSMERTNVRTLASLPEPIDLAVADVSFISLRLALPPIMRLLRPEAPILTLIKPQFEAGKGLVGKGGVVRDPAIHLAVLEELAAWSADQAWRLTDVIPSPIRGPAGNVEFLGYWLRNGEPAPREVLEHAVEDSPRTPTGGG